jgi:hypothetical protein
MRTGVQQTGESEGGNSHGIAARPSGSAALMLLAYERI